MSSFDSSLVSGVSQGLLWAIMALGVYITFRLLDIADMTVDGSFTTGGAVTAICMMAGYHPLFAILVATLAGMAAGMITGILTTRMKIPALLSGILTQIGLYTINLRIMGKANIPLTGINSQIENLFNWQLPFNASRTAVALIIGLIFTAVIIALMYLFFGTEIGAAIRATGNNPAMVRALGANTKNTTLFGLMLGNALVAISGGLVAQQQGYSDIGMGTGAIVIGLASIIIGEVLFPKTNFWFRLMGVAFGSIIYRIVITLILRYSPLKSYDLKLFTAVVVALALWLPYLLQQIREHKARRSNIPSRGGV